MLLCKKGLHFFSTSEIEQVMDKFVSFINNLFKVRLPFLLLGVGTVMHAKLKFCFSVCRPKIVWELLRLS